MPQAPDYRNDLAGRIGMVCGQQCYREVGALTGTNHETARRYVQGLSRPAPEFLAALCEVFGVSPMWLLCGRGPMRQRQEAMTVAPAAPRVPEARRLGPVRPSKAKRGARRNRARSPGPLPAGSIAD